MTTQSPNKREYGTVAGSSQPASRSPSYQLHLQELSPDITPPPTSTESRRRDTDLKENKGSDLLKSSEGMVEVHGSDGISEELTKCEKSVVKPYLRFLKVLGWEQTCQSEKPFVHILKVLYFILLLVTAILQNLTCFSRLQPTNYRMNNQSLTSMGHLLITCTNHLVIINIIPHLLILAAYCYGAYVFSKEPEELHSLIIRVFHAHGNEPDDGNDVMRKKKKKMTTVLRSYLIIGVSWIILDFLLNGVRIYTLQLFEKDSFNPTLRIPPDRFYNSSTYHTNEENALRYILILLSWFGFVLFDLLYFAVVVTYASHCQLVQYYIIRMMEKVKDNVYTTMKEAVKEIRKPLEYLHVINSHLSILTTLMIFLFLSSFLSSIYNLTLLPPRNTFNNYSLFYMGIIVGLANILQWGLLAALPIIQASRLTLYCEKFRRLGLEIETSELMKDNHQLDMTHFVLNTNATRYSAKLAGVPMYPSFVIGVTFLGGIVGSFTIVYNNHFLFANWF